MDEFTFSKIVSKCERIIANVNVKRLRPLSKEIISSIKKKMINVIYGTRGVGKTTLLSFLRKKEKSALYVSCDVLSYYGIDLLEFLEYSETKGFKTFLIDEVHFIPDWDLKIKIFFDETRSDIVITGSSSISISKGSELSRRAKYFQLKPLSFREYIYLKSGVKLNKISLHDLVCKEKRKEILKSTMKFYYLFDRYLKLEGIPAAINKDPEVYLNILNRIISFDLLNLKEIDIDYHNFVIKLMKFIVSSKPSQLSYTSLASNLKRSVKFVMETVRLLEIAGILYRVEPYGRGNKLIRKEDKIALPLSFRSSLANSFGIPYEIGALREDFVVQHLYPCNYVKTGKIRRTPDFIKGRYIFEVGGANKSEEQIKGYKNAFLVKDTITFEKNSIPLFLFGFLY